MQPRHVFFQSSNERACWFSNKNKQSIERQTDRWEKKMITGSWEEWFHLPASQLKPCLISVSRLCFSRWISPITPQVVPGEKRKQTETRNEHVGWEGRFTAGVLCGYGAWTCHIPLTNNRRTTLCTKLRKYEVQDKTGQQDWGLSYCEAKQQGNRGRKWAGRIFGSSPARTLLSIMYEKDHFTIKLLNHI